MKAMVITGFLIKFYAGILTRPVPGQNFIT